MTDQEEIKLDLIKALLSNNELMNLFREDDNIGMYIMVLGGGFANAKALANHLDKYEDNSVLLGQETMRLCLRAYAVLANKFAEEIMKECF